MPLPKEKVDTESESETNSYLRSCEKDPIKIKKQSHVITHQKVTLQGKKKSETADKPRSKKGQHAKSTSNSCGPDVLSTLVVTQSNGTD